MASSSKQPKPLPELVRDSQLETRFASKRRTVHTFHDTPTTTREEVWKRERLIGRGAFGDVWLEKCIKGQEPGGPETRAVKTLRFSSHEDNRSQVSEYARELEALAKFSQRKFSRCFVKSYGWFYGRDVLCVSLEYLPLGDLRGYISTREGRVSQLEARQIASQLLDGLKFMHGEGFTHRDLKPANVLIKDGPPSGSWWVVLSDFGLSKRVESFITGSSGLLGTPGYMAPELYGYFARELEGIDYSAADIWCVGEMSFQMITGEQTFSFQATLFSYARGECEFPAQKLRDCSADVDRRAIAFITALMIADPAQRPDAAVASTHPWVADQREHLVPTEECSSARGLNDTGSTFSDTSSAASSTSSDESGVWSQTVTKGKARELLDFAFPAEQSADGLLTRNNSQLHHRTKSTVDPPNTVALANRTYIQHDFPDHLLQVHSEEKVDTHLEITEAMLNSGDGVEVGGKSNESSLSFSAASPQPPEDVPRALSETSLPYLTITDPSQGQNITPETLQPVLPESPKTQGRGGLSAESISRLLPSKPGTKRLSHKSFLVKTLRIEQARHGEQCLAAAFSPMNTGILAVVNDHSVRLWDVRTGLVQKELRRREREPPGPETSTNAASSDPSNPTNGLNRCCIAFSPNAEALACSWWPVPHVYLFALPRGGRQLLIGHREPIAWLEFRPAQPEDSGWVLASASLDKIVRLWRPASVPRYLTMTLRRHPEPDILKHGRRTVWAGFITPSWGPYGELTSHSAVRVFSISEDGQEHLWKQRHDIMAVSPVLPRWKKIEDHHGLCRKDLAYHSGNSPIITTAAISPSEGWIAVGEATDAARGAIHLWYRDARHNCRFQTTISPIHQRGIIESVSFFKHHSSHEQLIAVMSDLSISIYTIGVREPAAKVLEITRPKSTMTTHNSTKAAFNSHLLALCSSTTSPVQVWDTRFLTDLTDLQHHLDRACFSAISQDGRYVASVSPALPARPAKSLSAKICTIMIWDVVNACPHRLIRTRIGALGEENSRDTEPLALSFSPDSKTIWCTTWTCRLQIWSVETGERLEDIPLDLGDHIRKFTVDPVRIGIVGPWLTGVACYHTYLVPPERKVCASIFVSRLRGIYPGVSTPVLSSASSDVFKVIRPAPDLGIISLALSHNANSLAEISEDGRITVWDLSPSLRIRVRTKIDFTAWQVVPQQTERHDDRNRPRIVFSPGDDRVAICARYSARIKIWAFYSNIDLCDVGDGLLTNPGIGRTENQQPHCVSPDWTRCVTRLSRGNSHSFYLFDMEKNITFVLPGQIYSLLEVRNLVPTVTVSPSLRIPDGLQWPFMMWAG